MLRLMFLLVVAGVLAPATAHASKVCENVVVGHLMRNNVPVAPQYQEQCRWVAGAVAFDPATRQMHSAWNQPTTDAAMAAVQQGCGASCAAFSFYEDFAFVAMSDDGAYGVDTTREGALAACRRSGDDSCEVVIGASSTAAAVYWEFGAVAYDAATGASGRSANRGSRRDATADAKRACGTPNCWAFSFQTGYGAIAKSADGQLFGAWSEKDTRFSNAGKEAQKACRKATGEKSCEVVVDGAAFDTAARIEDSRRRLDEALRRAESPN